MNAKNNESGVLVMGGEFVTRVTLLTLKKAEKQIRDMAEATPDLTFRQAVQMLEGKARITGDNVNGFSLQVDD